VGDMDCLAGKDLSAASLAAAGLGASCCSHTHVRIRAGVSATSASKDRPETVQVGDARCQEPVQGEPRRHRRRGKTEEGASPEKRKSRLNI
jgi:hypothetical protein